MQSIPPVAPQRLFAVIPAAGFSRRMGQPKLLLSLGGETLIHRLLRQLAIPDFSSIFILIRGNDRPLQQEITRSIHEIRETMPHLPDTQIVLTQSPAPDMKASVKILLQAVREAENPGPNDGWLLIPADFPVIEPAVLQRVLQAWNRNNQSIVAPKCGERRGHPTIFPWSLTLLISQIPANQGVNWLTHSNFSPVVEVPCEESSILWDLDTPEDLARMTEMLKKSGPDRS